MPHYVIGSRESELALVQANQVLSILYKAFPNDTFSIRGMTTTGDQILNVPLSQVHTTTNTPSGKGLFTKELEVSLMNHEIHMIVHSLKDVPTTLPQGLTIGAIMKREDPRDIVIIHPSLMKKGIKRLQELPSNSVIGTSSVRRIAQLKRKFPELQFKDIRGNLNTRLRKLDQGNEYDAIVLAFAGVARLHWTDRISQILGENEMLHAVGQGALGIECREDDYKVLEMLQVLNDKETNARCTAERQFMKLLEGGCSVPLGVYTTIHQNLLILKGSVTSTDGTREIVHEEQIELVDWTEHAKELGQRVAGVLKSRGADEILASIRHTK